MRLFGRLEVTVSTRPQVSSGTPNGSSISSSPELASVTRVPGSPGRPTTSQASRAPDTTAGSEAAGEAGEAGPPADGTGEAAGGTGEAAGAVSAPFPGVDPEHAVTSAAIAMVRSCRYGRPGDIGCLPLDPRGRTPTHSEYTDRGFVVPATPATRPAPSWRPAPGRSRSGTSCRRPSRRARHPPSGGRRRCVRGPRG